jgi:hypothetical protein
MFINYVCLVVNLSGKESYKLVDCRLEYCRGAQLPGARSPGQINTLCLAPNICGFLIWNCLLVSVSLVAPRILRWLVRSWQVCESLQPWPSVLQSTEIFSSMSRPNKLRGPSSLLCRILPGNFASFYHFFLFSLVV